MANIGCNLNKTGSNLIYEKSILLCMNELKSVFNVFIIDTIDTVIFYLEILNHLFGIITSIDVSNVHLRLTGMNMNRKRYDTWSIVFRFFLLKIHLHIKWFTHAWIDFVLKLSRYQFAIRDMEIFREFRYDKTHQCNNLSPSAFIQMCFKWRTRFSSRRQCVALETLRLNWLKIVSRISNHQWLLYHNR